MVSDMIQDTSSLLSSNFVATSGVPQGLVLGLFFYNIFNNDTVDELQVEYLLYFDDYKNFSTTYIPMKIIVFPNVHWK